MRNNSYKRIGERLAEAKSVCLFPHENPDGDAIGSCAAICSMLRGMGKTCHILIDEPLPENLRFMDDGTMFVIGTSLPEVPEVAMCVDCSVLSRFPERREFFLKSGFSICVDHHLSEKTYCDLNRIEPKAAAAGELVFRLMKAMGHKPTKTEGEALFAAITTDSGNFQYSSTSRTTHKIVCDLYDCGIDTTYVSTQLYQNVPMRKMELESMVIADMKLLADGQVVYARITQDMLKETGADMSDAESLVALIRSVKGVEIALLFKERANGKIFVSMRAKTTANVQKIAVAFGGGGHRKAAGCTLEMTMDEAIEKVTAAAVESLK